MAESTVDYRDPPTSDPPVGVAGLDDIGDVDDDVLELVALRTGDLTSRLLGEPVSSGRLGYFAGIGGDDCTHSLGLAGQFRGQLGSGITPGFSRSAEPLRNGMASWTIATPVRVASVLAASSRGSSHDRLCMASSSASQIPAKVSGKSQALGVDRQQSPAWI